MTKFHINKHGVPAPCKAKAGNCPLGGDTGGDNHFDSIEEAEEYVNSKFSGEHGLLPGMSNIEDNKDENEFIKSAETNRDPYGSEKERAILKSKISSELYSDPMDEAAHASGHTLEDFIEERAGIELGNNTKHMKISESEFTKIAYDSFDDNGYENVGLTKDEFERNINFGELEDNLKDEIYNSTNGSKEWTLVKKDNVQSLVDNHIISDSGYRNRSNESSIKSTHNEMMNDLTSLVKKANPDLIEVDSDGNEVVSERGLSDFKGFVAKDLMKNSRLVINGEGFYIANSETYKKNFVEDYANSNPYILRDKPKPINRDSSKTVFERISGIFGR